jgi:hypothetical protein
MFPRTDLGTPSRSEEIHESGSTDQGLSRMKGNFHVRFLGGWGQATVPGYPRAGRAGHMAKGGRWTWTVGERGMRDAKSRPPESQAPGEPCAVKVASTVRGGL